MLVSGLQDSVMSHAVDANASRLHDEMFLIAVNATPIAPEVVISFHDFVTRMT